MGVLFNNIPGNIRVPLFYAEFQPGGTPYQSNARLLLVGQKLATGLATVEQPIMVRDGQEAGLFGSGSMLADMYRIARRNAPLQEIWALPVDDLSGGVKASGKVSISGAPLTQAGVLSIYIAGERVRIGVNTSDTNATLATALAAAVNATPNLPVTAAVVIPTATSFTAGTTSGSPTLTVADTSGLIKGMVVAGTGVPVGSVITAIVSNTSVTISANATATGSNVSMTGTESNSVTFTARHKGTLGNAIEIDAGTLTEDGAPPVGLAFTAMSGGSGDPDLQTALASLGDDEYDWIAAPYADTVNLGRVSDLLGDTSGRWSYIKQIYGHYICTHVGTVGALSTLGNSRNDQHVSIVPCRKFLSTPWMAAAAVGAVAAMHLQDAPELSRPLQSLPLVGIKGPRLKADQLTKTDRQTLYYDGISGYYVDRDGTIRIDRVVTTYQSNAWGDPDWTYLDIETMAQSMYGIRYIRTLVTSRHGRQALANDNPGRLPHIATPIDIRNTVLHAYSRLVNEEGVFENLDAFRDSLVVERDATDANRVNVGMKLDHVNQLRIIAAAAVNYMQLTADQAAA